ncbi:5'-AMP-activated protein kinase catalytic subunit alpha-1 [Cytospora mali]|uniref:EKC/KEOPS complex subunit BUD32 n=1 Tax=Cytospora mali TaxID=578113 RepID=A0A194VV33_CYTMA|nr:5'-AMP-activated protein kinase catalytic subunit alpha-1 [Valsa mali]
MSSLRFATLTPENEAAQKCLASLVDKQFPHFHQNPESSINPVAAVVSAPRQSTHRAAQSKYQLNLSFHNQGHGLNGAWIIGKSGPKTAAIIDLPICSSRSRQLKAPQVCEIFIHPQSGVLILRNVNTFHSIIYLQADGNNDVELQYGDEHVLHMVTNHLRIGKLDYVLNISVDDERAYLTSRNDYMRRWSRDWENSLVQRYGCLSPLPRPTHVRIGNMITHQTISQGAFGVVRVGVDRRSGDIVGCKTIHCRRYRDVQTVNNEIDIASKVLPHTVGLTPLICSWCEHGQSPPCFQTPLEDVHLLMPYAPFSFDTTAWHEIPLATRLALFHQVLEGLRNLHAAGIMHRDISPRNLLVFSYQPPIAAICDFGKSKQGTKGIQTSLGPPAFLAPEVGRGEYTNSIDIFSLGLSMLATFKMWEWTGPLSNRDSHTRVLEHLASLQSRMPDGLGALLRSMLAWDSADRPTADQALADKAWGQIVVMGPGSEKESARETQSSGGGSGPGPSRTRTRLQRSGGPSPSASGGINKRIRRSDAPPPSRSETDLTQKRRSESSGAGMREKKSRTSDSRSLLSPPPA